MTRINFGLHSSDGWGLSFENIAKCVGYNFLCAKRHFEHAFAKEPEVFHNGKWVVTLSESVKGKSRHIVLGCVELIPVIGHIVALVERFFGKNGSLPIIGFLSETEQMRQETNEANAATKKEAEEKVRADTAVAEQAAGNAAINEFISDPDYKMLTDQKYRLKEIENIEKRTEQKKRDGISAMPSIEEVVYACRLRLLQGQRERVHKNVEFIFSRQESFKNNVGKVKEIFDVLQKKANSMRLRADSLILHTTYSTRNQITEICRFSLNFSLHISEILNICQTHYDIQAVSFLPSGEKRTRFLNLCNIDI